MEFNLAQVHEAVAAAIPDRECIVWRDRRLTYARGHRPHPPAGQRACATGASASHRERSELGGHESGQDHLALYLHNGNEYLEGMLGAYKARVGAVQRQLPLRRRGAALPARRRRRQAVVYHCGVRRRRWPRCCADAARPRRADPGRRRLGQRPAARRGRLRGRARRRPRPNDPTVEWSPDDLYILYTGGTTGMPKGVLWRQHDIFVGAMGGRPFGQASEFESLERDRRGVDATAAVGMMPRPPFMHGAAHWAAFTPFTGGNTVVIPTTPSGSTRPTSGGRPSASGCTILQIVGDAFARPLLDELERGDYDLSRAHRRRQRRRRAELRRQGAAARRAPRTPWSSTPSARRRPAPRWATRRPRGSGRHRRRSRPVRARCVVSEDLDRACSTPGDERDRLAGPGGLRAARLPRRRRQDRPHVPGDRRRALLRARRPGPRRAPTAIIELLGRDSVTINSGGEKIFAEEVEQAHRPPPGGVRRGRGRPAERAVGPGGRRGRAAAPTAPTRHRRRRCSTSAPKHIARYKLPKAFVFRRPSWSARRPARPTTAGPRTSQQERVAPASCWFLS